MRTFQSSRVPATLGPLRTFLAMKLPAQILMTSMAPVIQCTAFVPAPPRFVSTIRATSTSTSISCSPLLLASFSRFIGRGNSLRVSRLSLLGKDHVDDSATSSDSAVGAKLKTSPLSRAKEVLAGPEFVKLLGLMAASGALLGPNLDNYHSAFGVLTYKNPTTLYVAGHALVTTDWWVPPLFAVAGAGIGALYIIFDALLETPRVQRQPAWRNVFLAISLFSFQYYLSGLLVANGCPRGLLVVCLAVIAERTFKIFDDTRAGLVVSIAAAVLGPLIEVFLINVLGLYIYNGADLLGVDSWIPVRLSRRSKFPPSWRAGD
ncbi:unnamed protein product [Ascophyllum nodosum]